MASTLIALMTDFGLKDPFAGIIKGVILGINPSAQIVDVCHEINRGDIPAASFALSSAFPYFPDGTIFTIVIDPGVGGERKAIAAEVDGKLIVCPDNGIVTWVLHSHPLVKAVELSNPKYFLPEVSDTFHGRDIFAPVAAHLSNGVPLEEFGPQISDLVTFPIPEVTGGDRSIHGEIVYVDRFGNLVTNVSREQLKPWQGKSGFGPVRIHVGSAEIEGINRTYSDVPKGRAVAVFGSSGFLEMAVNGGSAQATLGASVGSHILVYQLPE